MDPLSKRLKQRAKELGLADAEIARRAGLSERRYGHYVTGEREPDLRTLLKISGVLALTPNDLLLPERDVTLGSRRDALEARFRAALNVLSEQDLALAMCQVECLVDHRVPHSS